MGQRKRRSRSKYANNLPMQCSNVNARLLSTFGEMLFCNKEDVGEVLRNDRTINPGVIGLRASLSRDGSKVSTP